MHPLFEIYKNIFVEGLNDPNLFSLLCPEAGSEVFNPSAPCALNDHPDPWSGSLCDKNFLVSEAGERDSISVDPGSASALGNINIPQVGALSGSLFENLNLEISNLKEKSLYDDLKNIYIYTIHHIFEIFPDLTSEYVACIKERYPSIPLKVGDTFFINSLVSENFILFNDGHFALRYLNGFPLLYTDLIENSEGLNIAENNYINIDVLCLHHKESLIKTLTHPSSYEISEMERCVSPDIGGIGIHNPHSWYCIKKDRTYIPVIGNENPCVDLLWEERSHLVKLLLEDESKITGFKIWAYYRRHLDFEELRLAGEKFRAVSTLRFFKYGQRAIKFDDFVKGYRNCLNKRLLSDLFTWEESLRIESIKSDKNSWKFGNLLRIEINWRLLLRRRAQEHND